VIGTSSITPAYVTFGIGKENISNAIDESTSVKIATITAPHFLPNPSRE
jgi:hypothetical protein